MNFGINLSYLYDEYSNYRIIYFYLVPHVLYLELKYTIYFIFLIYYIITLILLNYMFMIVYT